ncbi:hypothetical protein EYF80_024915 [Liparis tanakae]|uniref:Uncharacterized protein n=1 Tax=Liparis tanakae TaxID=230148 RepID=A0A4Z2HIR3_9TELE|nr:hypothetical protein EYF80_024915 [Liparis tanakae]
MRTCGWRRGGALGEGEGLWGRGPINYSLGASLLSSAVISRNTAHNPRFKDRRERKRGRGEEGRRGGGEEARRSEADAVSSDRSEPEAGIVRLGQTRINGRGVLEYATFKSIELWTVKGNTAWETHAARHHGGGIPPGMSSRTAAEFLTYFKKEAQSHRNRRARLAITSSQRRLDLRFNTPPAGLTGNYTPGQSRSVGVMDGVTLIHWTIPTEELEQVVSRRPRPAC